MLDFLRAKKVDKFIYISNSNFHASQSLLTCGVLCKYLEGKIAPRYMTVLVILFSCYSVIEIDSS